MADTSQYVGWHLRQACPFRQGEAVDVFAKAFHATDPLRRIDDAIARGDVYGDVCVTAVSYSGEGQWPSGGFRISDAVAPVGDLAAARRTCGECPANALPPPKMAGCCGFLPVDADNEEVDAALRAALGGGLAGEFGAAFVRTDPIWYGLWISDPLSPAQLRLLPRLLQTLPASNGDSALRQFCRACEQAVLHGVELHVHLSPPGHTDFGFYTIFPHCPRCKRGTGERWTTPSAQMTTCRTCGHRFTPAETAKSEEDDLDELDLKDRLSPEEYAAVNKAWQERHASDPSLLDQFFKC